MRAFDPNFLTNSFTNSFIRGKFSPNQKFTFRKTTLNMTWGFSYYVRLHGWSTANMKTRWSECISGFISARNTRVGTCDSLVIDAFRDAVQMPLRKESRFRRSPLAVGWFCLVLEHAAGGCRRRLQERRTLKLAEARRVESKGGVQAGLRPCGVPRSIQLGNWTGELAETGGGNMI